MNTTWSSDRVNIQNILKRKLTNFLHIYTLQTYCKPFFFILFSIYNSTLIHYITYQPRSTIVLSKKWEGKTNQIEKWYQIHYSVHEYTPEQMQLWQNNSEPYPELHVPLLNPWVCKIKLIWKVIKNN